MESQEHNHAPKASATGTGSFIKRELNGSTFLSLEHAGHMLLVVLVPMLVLAGLTAALGMWTHTSMFSNAFLGGAQYMGLGGSSYEATIAIGIVAALVVLTPLLVILDRRTRAEWHKRPAYAGRLAYKAPIYTALAVLATTIVAAKIQLLTVVLESLVHVGVPDAPIGAMYLTSFLPALVSLVVACGTAWYVFKLAKGRDNGRMFSASVAFVSVVTIVALFITSLTVLHGAPSGQILNPLEPAQDSPIYNQDYNDILDQYNR